MLAALLDGNPEEPLPFGRDFPNCAPLKPADPHQVKWSGREADYRLPTGRFLQFFLILNLVLFPDRRVKNPGSGQKLPLRPRADAV